MGWLNANGRAHGDVRILLDCELVGVVEEMTGQSNSFERWGNLIQWVSQSDNDYHLLERSAYFAQIHYPRCRRIIGDIE